MMRIRLNEKFGLIFLGLMVLSFVSIFYFDVAVSYIGVLLFALSGFFGIVANIFLSYWGLTTFNERFSK